MGILDDAIREHLELKRQHGAGSEDLERLEKEAFGPATRPGDPEFADPDAEGAPDAEGHPRRGRDARPGDRAARLVHGGRDDRRTGGAAELGRRGPERARRA